MWLRLGRWVELGVHFGTPNRRLDSADRYHIHAAVRFGKREWYHGPFRREPAEDINAHSSGCPQPPVELYPDPEPLSWGIRR